MIKKLRKKVVLINVIAVFIVFVIAVAVMFGSGYKRISEERFARFRALLEYDNWEQAVSHQFGGTVIVEYDLATNKVVNKSTSVSVKMSPESIDDIIDKVVSSKDDEGWLERVQFVKKVDKSVLRIVIYDRYVNANNSKMYGWLSLTSLVVGAACYLIISLVLANIALKPVEDSWNKQRQFVADASHELKTPLSVIMANTELLASHGDETVASQMKWIENTRSESQRMAELVNDLLFLAKNDDGLKAQMEVVDISDCIETIVLSHEALIYEKGKIFSYEIEPHLHVFGNMGQIKQLATILLDNATMYSQDKGNIQLKVAISGKYVQLVISNDCEKLSEQQLKHLFDRFYTVDQSRNKSSAGNGLGLSIAQVICQTHRGDITVDYSDGRITFTATLPLNKNK